MAMLSAVDPLRLEFLNHSTQAWVEQEYNRTRHDELGVSPLDRYLQGQDVGRPSPELTHLHFLFTRIVTRRQRHGDGTVSIAGIRFEVPGSMRHLERLTLRYAAWDLSQVYLVDPRHTTQKLATIYPQDKRRNANQQRRTVQPTETTTPVKPADSVPPLLRKLMQDYAATGLPPAYLPHLPACEEEPHA
jgi:putative transposase